MNCNSCSAQPISASPTILPFTFVTNASQLAPGTSRRDFDTALRAANGNKNTQYDGYLPYQITDGWQQVRKDFGIWRGSGSRSTRGCTSRNCQN